MEILFYSEALPELSSVEHIRDGKPEKIWDTWTLYVYSRNIEPEKTSCRAVLDGYLEVFEEAGGGERGGGGQEEEGEEKLQFCNIWNTLRK